MNLATRRREPDTNDWIKLDRDPRALYRGLRLQQMSEWARGNADLISLSEQEFLDASRRIGEEENAQRLRLARARRTQITLASAAVILGVVVLVTLLAVNGVFAPRKMSGIFNVAVAECGTGPDGTVRSSAAGKQMGEWAVTYLRNELKKQDLNLSVWPDSSNFFRPTRVGLVQASTAGEKAWASISSPPKGRRHI